jgi:hypothetical protein
VWFPIPPGKVAPEAACFDPKTRFPLLRARLTPAKARLRIFGAVGSRNAFSSLARPANSGQGAAPFAAWYGDRREIAKSVGSTVGIAALNPPICDTYELARRRTQKLNFGYVIRQSNSLTDDVRALWRFLSIRQATSLASWPGERWWLNIDGGKEQEADDVSKLSDAELIQQLADTVKELGIEINLNYSFLQRNKPDEEPQG